MGKCISARPCTTVHGRALMQVRGRLTTSASPAATLLTAGGVITTTLGTAAAHLRLHQRRQREQPQTSHNQQQTSDANLMESITSLLTATGADGVSPLLAEQRPLFQQEPFEVVYEIGELLGNGTYGVVRTCTHRVTGQRYAVKVLQRRRNKVDRWAAIQNEVAMASQVQWCRSVARTYSVHIDTYSVYIVQELLAGGSLQGLLDAQGKLSEPEAASALHCVLDALLACHTEGICYGDVKPANLVLPALYPSVAHLSDPSLPKGPLELRMVDFGCARACPGESTLEGLSGTPVYMAPEVAAGQPYGPASDLWGVGVMLYQLLTGRFPFWDGGVDALREMPTAQVLADVSSAAVMLDAPACAALSAGSRDLLRALLERDPERRISAHDALRHPWLVAHGFGVSAAPSVLLRRAEGIVASRGSVSACALGTL